MFDELKEGNYFKEIIDFKSLRGCSYENNFPVVFPLNRKKEISSRSYTKYFSAWAKFILAVCQVGKFLEKPIFKMSDINLKKNGSVLLYLNISEFDSHFMFDGSLQLLVTQRQHRTFMSSLLKPRQKIIV